MRQTICVPSIGDYKNVPVIEIMVKPGQVVGVDASLLVLETDKATMEVPAPVAGTIVELLVKVGDKISEGTPIAVMDASEQVVQPAVTTAAVPASTTSAPTTVARAQSLPGRDSGVHAGPATRKLARELGIDLKGVSGTGPKNRILTTDLHAYIKLQLAKAKNGGGLNLIDMPVVDFAQYGAITEQPLTRIKQLTGQHLHRNWVQIPHVTQFDEADITDLESMRAEMQAKGMKLTPLVFIFKALIATLKEYPTFNASLSNDGQTLILKNYYHLGVAVETPQGLVVPVLKDADQKDIKGLAEGLSELSLAARESRLKGPQLQGSSFSVTSLGGIGGTYFTPIIHAPNVAILGLSKMRMTPVWQEKTQSFEPRKILPLSLSYDHRVIDGAEAARFTRTLATHLANIRALIQ